MRAFAFLLSVSCILCACTDNDQFRVNGVIEGNPTLNLRVGYYADGAYQTQITAAREGKFEFYGSSKQPTLVEILDYDYRPLTRIYAANGETFEINIDRAKPLEARITGNDITERWSTFLRNNSAALTASGDSANKIIARYVAENPDDIVSTLLMITAYNASADAFAADSIMSMIEPRARPSALTESFVFMVQRIISDEAFDSITPFKYADRKDSINIFDPAKKPLSLIALTRSNSFRTDSIVPALSNLAKHKDLQILEIDLEPFFKTLRERSDTIKWNIGMIPGGFAGSSIEKLGIPGQPFFIVTDSTGTQLLRTPHPAVAASFIKERP